MTQTLVCASLLLLLIVAPLVYCAQYGCHSGESCILSSSRTTFVAEDVLYCTSAIDTCTVECLTPQSCESLVIYSAAATTTLVCNATRSCLNSTVYIGDTSVYPLTFSSQQFRNNKPTTSHIACNADESCASLQLTFTGSWHDTCSLYSSAANAFHNGNFDCTINATTSASNNAVCNLFCDSVLSSECLGATLACNDATSALCSCHGNDCDSQNIARHSTLSTTSIIPVATHIDSSELSSLEQLLGNTTIKLILIGLIGIIVCLACTLLLCCWKFESIYEAVYNNKHKKSEGHNQFDHVRSRSDMDSALPKKQSKAGIKSSYHTAQNSGTTPSPPSTVELTSGHSAGSQHTMLVQVSTNSFRPINTANNGKRRNKKKPKKTTSNARNHKQNKDEDEDEDRFDLDAEVPVEINVSMALPAPPQLMSPDSIMSAISDLSPVPSEADLTLAAFPSKLPPKDKRPCKKKSKKKPPPRRRSGKTTRHRSSGAGSAERSRRAERRKERKERKKPDKAQYTKVKVTMTGKIKQKPAKAKHEHRSKHSGHGKQRSHNHGHGRTRHHDSDSDVSSEVEGRTSSSDDSSDSQDESLSTQSDGSSESTSHDGEKETFRDGEKETETRLLNVDDMVANMVMMIQKTPADTGVSGHDDKYIE